jgi:histidinol-phosphate/aromatic aminotransferase/cobyric acid decarboxylase-like protein
LAVLRESVAGGNRYPRTEYETLKKKLAALHRVKPEQIVLGCGSAEILCMSAHAFLGPGKKLVQAAPTFPALGKLAAGAGIEVGNVPLNKRYEHDLEAMLERTRSSTGLVYIVNPQQSYGNDHAAQRHRRFCQQAAERRHGYRRRGLPSLRQPWRLVRVFPGPGARRSAPDCLPHILEGVWPSRHAYRLRRR